MSNPMTYEQVLEMMKQLTPEETQTRLQESMKDCICASCPTYVGTRESKLLFCAMGKSESITKEKGCICPGCPVQTKMALRWDYYCTKGSGMELLAQEAK